MKIADQNKIITAYICEVEYDGHTFEVFGSAPKHEAPEVEQIAFKGIPADISHLLDGRVIQSIYNMVESMWLQDAIQQAYDAAPMILGNQAHTLRNI